ncbi:hypothetical protein KM043_013532 [Ampulex compressa]|nr:hypothetical protein KM043_013532 [Ampulex compressa]
MCSSQRSRCVFDACNPAARRLSRSAAGPRQGRTTKSSQPPPRLPLAGPDACNNEHAFVKMPRARTPMGRNNNYPAVSQGGYFTSRGTLRNNPDAAFPRARGRLLI